MVDFNAAVDLRTREKGLSKEEKKLLKNPLFPPGEFLNRQTHENPDFHYIGESLPAPSKVGSGTIPTVGKSAYPAREDHVHGMADSNGNVNINTSGAGTIFLNGKAGYLPTALSEYQGATLSPCPGYIAFLANGVNISNCKAATDTIWVTFTAIIFLNANSAFRGLGQVFGPSGNVQTQIDAMYASVSVAGYWNVGYTFLYNLNLGNGTYTVAMIGGMQAGSGTLYTPRISVMRFSRN